MSTADANGERSRRGHATGNEAPDKRRWKRAVNGLQVCTLLAAACATYVVIGIERRAETRNVEQEKVARSLNIAREFSKETNAREIIKNFTYDMDVKLNQITSRFGLDADLVQSNLNSFILTEYNIKNTSDDLTRSLNERLDIIDIMKSCLTAMPQLCDLDTLMVSSQDEIIDLYVYFKPVFVCDEFYKYGSNRSAATDLYFMLQKLVDWSPEYYNDQEQILNPNRSDAYLLNIQIDNISCASYRNIADSRKYRD